MFRWFSYDVLLQINTSTLFYRPSSRETTDLPYDSSNPRLMAGSEFVIVSNRVLGDFTIKFVIGDHTGDINQTHQEII